MPTSDELAEALEAQIQDMKGWAFTSRVDEFEAELRTLARDAAKQALNDEADRLESFVSGYTSETPQTRAGRDIIAQIRARAEQIGTHDGD